MLTSLLALAEAKIPNSWGEIFTYLHSHEDTDFQRGQVTYPKPHKVVELKFESKFICPKPLLFLV